MAANTDILMGYFDSLLTTTAVVEDDPRKAIVSDLLASAATDSPASVYAPALSDTIDQGRRMITLHAPARMISRAGNRATALQLISVASGLQPGRLKRQVLTCCAGVLDV